MQDIKPEPGGELEKQLALLSEDQKRMQFMGMLDNIDFGDLTVKKRKGKIVSYNFSGEILFKPAPKEKT
jgi:hypothetical protein